MTAMERIIEEVETKIQRDNEMIAIVERGIIEETKEIERLRHDVSEDKLVLKDLVSLKLRKVAQLGENEGR